MYQTAMKTTQLGQTGLEVTRLGFGAWAIGAIVGFRRPDQIDPILTGGNLELTNGDIAEIEGSTP